MGTAARRLGVGAEVVFREYKAKTTLNKAESLFLGRDETVLKNKTVDYKAGYQNFKKSLKNKASFHNFLQTNICSFCDFIIIDRFGTLHPNNLIFFSFFRLTRITYNIKIYL